MLTLDDSLSVHIKQETCSNNTNKSITTNNNNNTNGPISLIINIVD